MYIVVYDICDKKRLKQVSRCLRHYGCRVQKSVFECHIDRKNYDRLRVELAEICQDRDRIFSYLQHWHGGREEIF